MFVPIPVYSKDRDGNYDWETTSLIYFNKFQIIGIEFDVNDKTLKLESNFWTADNDVNYSPLPVHELLKRLND